MLRTRWNKVLLDLVHQKTRTILVILAITVGVFAIGFIASAQAILLRELRASYQAAAVSSATLYTMPFDQTLVDRIADLPEVEAAEGRAGFGARITNDNVEWNNVSVTVIDNYEEMPVDRIIPIEGAWPPDRQEIILERQSVAYFGADIGDTITIELPNGERKELVISGTAYDTRVPGADIAGIGFAYINFDTYQKLGLSAQFTELRFRVAENEGDLEHINAVTTLVKDRVEKSGREVFAVNTPPPGEHWAENIVETMVLLFFVFGGIILFLAGFLVVNTITALITQQTEQIGIMKLVGANRGQIMTMYIGMVIVYGAIALLVGIPAGIQMGRVSVGYATQQLNVIISDQSVPINVILIQVAVGLLIPLMAAFWPVTSGVQISTQQALNSSGIEVDDSTNNEGGGWLQGLLHRFSVQRPLILPIRNTIRRKGRLILTLLILVMGTALFISVLSVRSSVEVTLENFLRYHRFDLGMTVNRPYRSDQLVNTALSHPNVTAAEAWMQIGSRRIRPDDTESANYGVVALPPMTDFIEPQPEEGRWLDPEDTNAIVVNTFFMSEEGDLAVGDTMTLSTNNRENEWVIVGVVPAPMDGNTKFYVNYEYFSYLNRSVGQANSVQLEVLGPQAEQEAALIDFFADNGYQISRTTTSEGVRAEYFMRFQIVILFLIVMAMLLAAVGGMGLTTTMSINVLERIREIGVLRAIGASNGAIRRIVVAEGLAVGLLSWFVGIIFSIPLSIVLSNQIGLVLLRTPLDFRYSILGAFFWLFALLVLAALASLGPAQSASRLTIREVLATE